MSALRGNDWSRWRPEVIVMEAYGFDMMPPRAHAATSFMIDNGYVLDAKIAGNVISRVSRASESR